jgi:MerR family transcriptional regulator, light-induced transcriptional regulator
MERFTLNDLESLSGIKSDTIRIWERRYGILNPNRTVTRRRWYTGDDLTRLMNISLLYSKGLKISRIARLSDSELNERVSSIGDGDRRSSDQIAAIVVSMNRFDEATVNEILLKSIIARGIEATYSEIVFPFMQKLGFLWQTGSVTIGSEHFISGIFRKRIISAIDSLHSTYAGKGPRFLLFLPEGELHELGLLFYNYLILRRGGEVLYLGQSNPINSVIQVAGQWDPDVIITGTLSGIGQSNPSEYLKQLNLKLPGKMILAAGALADEADKINISEIKALRNASDIDLILKSFSLKIS